MADYIDKKQALNALESLRGVLGDAETDVAKKLISGLDDPVVRCKDCQSGEADDPDFPELYFCRDRLGWHNAEFFCAIGGRKGEEDE